MPVVGCVRICGAIAKRQKSPGSKIYCSVCCQDFLKSCTMRKIQLQRLDWAGMFKSSDHASETLTKTRTPHVIGVIPARLASTRLPRKVLREIAGEPMIGWVHRAASQAHVFEQLIVAADSEELAQLCRDRGWEFQLTSPELASGTDRVRAVASRIAAENPTTPISMQDIFVNIQGDEPLLRPIHFHTLLQPFADPEVQVSTLRTPCPDSQISNPNVVKVVVNTNSEALYFSRAPIPWDRDGQGSGNYWKHLGIYAYRWSALQRFPSLPHSILESTERLEQLRLLENGIEIHVQPVEFDTVGVDTEEDLHLVEALLKARFSDSV